MTTAITPYRKNAIVERAPLVNSSVRTGLIIASRTSSRCEERCEMPSSWIEVTYKKILCGLLSVRNEETQYSFIRDTLYRCPDCLKIYRMGYSDRYAKSANHCTWIKDATANTMWSAKTGEEAGDDGES